MILPRREVLRLGFGAAALSTSWWTASAQEYPSRSITIVVPFPAGGPGDTVARVLTDHMRASLGQPVIIENVSGAAGNIGTGRVARAVPDGHTLVLGYWGTHVVNGAIYALPYDVVNDFEPVALLPGQPLMVVAKKAMPAADLNGLIAWLAAHPDEAVQGTGGLGSISHIAGIFFQRGSSTRYRFVPYRGAAPIMQDLVAGQIDLGITVPVASMPHVRSGAIKAYAVMAKTRLAIAPEIPTVDEAGLPGMHLSLWQGLWAPKGTPQSVTAKLNTAIVRALADPAVQQKLAAQGFDMPSREQQASEALRIHQKNEIEKWWPILKAANITGE